MTKTDILCDILCDITIRDQRVYVVCVHFSPDSPNWVLFQPNIVIDAKLGCLWYVKLRLESLCNLITDRVKLVELLLNRTNAKLVLLGTVKEMLTTQYSGTLLPVIENVFDKLNAVYS